MDLRPGFSEITDGWMLVDDNDALFDRLRDILRFIDIQGELSTDELSTADLMLKSWSARTSGSAAIAEYFSFADMYELHQKGAR